MPEIPRFTTDRLTLEEYGRIGKNVIGYSVIMDDKAIGFLDLDYPDKPGKVTIDGVRLDEDFIGKGLGQELYENIPNLPTPDGKSLIEAGHVFGSSHIITNAAKAVWLRLEKEGKAHLSDEGYYVLDQPEGANPADKPRSADKVA
jgi:GNAT superfamily N-acetyltransferase